MNWGSGCGSYKVVSEILIPFVCDERGFGKDGRQSRIRLKKMEVFQNDFLNCHVVGVEGECQYRSVVRGLFLRWCEGVFTTDDYSSLEGRRDEIFGVASVEEE